MVHAMSNRKTVFNVRDYGAKGDTKQVLDGAITTGTTTLTSATASFATTDVGKTIAVVGAGTTGQAVTLKTTIASRTNSTTVELTASASLTVSGAVVTYGTNDTTAFTNMKSAIVTNGGGTAYVPKGKYFCDPEIHYSNTSGVTFTGESSRATTIYMIPSASFSRLIYIDGSNSSNIISGLYIKDIRLSGSAMFGFGFVPQNDNVYGIAIAYTNNTYIRNVEFECFHYDIANSYDTATCVDKCKDITGTLTSGVWYGSQGNISSRGSTLLRVINNEFYANDTCFRLVGARNSKVLGNEYRYASIEVSNAEGYSYSQYITIANNDAYGVIYGVNMESFGDAAPDTLSIDGYVSAVDTIDIHDNRFTLTSAQAGTGVIATLSGATTSIMSNIKVHDNTIIGQTSTAIASNGIVLGGLGAGVLRVDVHDNDIQNVNDEGIWMAGAVDSKVHDNRITNFNRRNNADGASRASGIRIEGDATHPTSNLEVYGNSIDGKSTTSANGIYIGTPANISGVHLKNNRSYNVTNYLTLSSTLPASSDGFDNIGINPQIIYAQGNITGATTFTRVNGSTITGTATGNVTTTVTNGVVAGDTLTLIITQDATGSRTISKPSNVKLVGGAFSPTATANAVDSWTLQWDGTNWREVSRSLNMS